MNSIWVQLLGLAVLISTNGIFAGSEMALVSLRESQVRRLGARGRRGDALRRLHADPNRYLSAIQIGITLAGFLASAIAAVTLADRLDPYLSLLGSWSRFVSVVIVTALLTYLTLVLGELAPKRIAMRRAEGWSLAVARPLSWFARITLPFVKLLGASTDVVVRIVGIDPQEHRKAVSEDEFQDMVAASEDFTATERDVLSGALEVGDRTLGQILIPRMDVVTLDENARADEALRRLVDSGHSRAPVVGPRGLDDLVGIVHMRDLVGAEGAVRKHSRPAATFPDSLGALDALRALQSGRQQMAIVVNEHMAAEGIVTMEDLLEEIVGEIWDETDRDLQRVEEGPAGVLVLPGAFPIHDLPDLGIELPDGPYTTLAGLVLTHMKRLPARPGDRVTVGSWCLEVVGIQRLAITKVRVVPRSE